MTNPKLPPKQCSKCDRTVWQDACVDKEGNYILKSVCLAHAPKEPEYTGMLDVKLCPWASNPKTCQDICEHCLDEYKQRVHEDIVNFKCEITALEQERDHIHDLDNAKVDEILKLKAELNDADTRHDILYKQYKDLEASFDEQRRIDQDILLERTHRIAELEAELKNRENYLKRWKMWDKYCMGVVP